MTAKVKLGQILLAMGAIDEYQLKSALGYQKKWGGRLGRVLVENRFITEETLVEGLHRQSGVPVVELNGRHIPDSLLKLVPEELAAKHKLIPVELEGEPGKPGDTLSVAVADPTDLSALDELRFKTAKHIRAFLAGEAAIDRSIAVHYRKEPIGAQPREVDPESIQFGGQEIDAAEMELVQGKLEAAPGETLIEDPAVEMRVAGDPLVALESLPGSTTDPLDTHPSEELDIEVDVDPSVATQAAEEELEELEILEKLQPVQPAGARSAASEAAAATTPALLEQRESSVFGDGPPGWPQKLEAAITPAGDVETVNPPASADDGAQELMFGEDDGLDLDAVLEPISPPGGPPPGGSPPVKAPQLPAAARQPEDKHGAEWPAPVERADVEPSSALPEELEQALDVLDDPRVGEQTQLLGATVEQPAVVALVRLLVNKGLITEEELLAELCKLRKN